MFLPTELISMRRTTGAGGLTGGAITQPYAATFLLGGAAKTRILRQASRTWRTLDVACCS